MFSLRSDKVDIRIIAGGGTCNLRPLRPRKRLIFNRALMPEDNRACMPSKTVVSDSASCRLPTRMS